MASLSGKLVAYEYALGNSGSTAAAGISSTAWDAFGREFAAYVQAADIADLVSLKDKSCINGGEYPVPRMRALFRIPTNAVTPIPASGGLESGWAAGIDGGHVVVEDDHVTKTKQTAGGTVAVSHCYDEHGEFAIPPQEVTPQYTEAMWAAAKSDSFWATGRTVGVGA